MSFFKEVQKMLFEEAVKKVAPVVAEKSMGFVGDFIDGAVNGAPRVPNKKEFVINYEGQPKIFSEIVEYIKDNYNTYYDENTISIFYENVEGDEISKMQLLLDKQNRILEMTLEGDHEGEYIENIIHYEYSNFIMKADLHGYDYVEVDDIGSISGGLEPMFSNFLELEKEFK